MFCRNCGNELNDNDNFCSKCGQKREEDNTQNIDFDISQFGKDRISACLYLKDNYNLSLSEAKKIVDEKYKQQNKPVNKVIENQRTMSDSELQAKIQLEQLKLQKEQFDSMIKCPKCGSTSITANKKGYGVVKGGLGALLLGGATLGLGTVVGLGAGNIGKNKVICTCINCGNKFEAGKR